jgi:hypothetical protein
LKFVDHGQVLVFFFFYNKIYKQINETMGIHFQVPGDKRNKKTKDGMYLYFHELAKRGNNVEVNQKFSGDFYPIRPNQDIISFNVYYTSKYDAKYCGDPGMRLLGIIRVKTHDTHLGLNRPIEFSLTFGKVEIKAIARNKSTGEIYNETTFELDL